VEDFAEDFGSFGEQLGGCFFCRVAVADAPFVLSVNGEPYCFILGDFRPSIKREQSAINAPPTSLANGIEMPRRTMVSSSDLAMLVVSRIARLIVCVAAIDRGRPAVCLW